MKNNHFVYLIFILIAVIIFFEVSNLDLYVNNKFYNFEKKIWLIKSIHNISGIIFYSGIKTVLILFGLGCLFLFLLSFFRKTVFNLNIYKIRIRLFFIFICMISVPSFVSFLKHVSNIYPPWDLKIYGSDKPYVKLFERYPIEFKQSKKAQGYPAGHASGGFSLICLFFVFKKNRNKILAIVFAHVIGWSMGIFQMMRGAHFLSHTIVSNILSILIINIVFNIFKNKIYKEFLYEKNN